jgi:hypothetical protein
MLLLPGGISRLFPLFVITLLPWLRPWPEIQTHSTACWYLLPEIEVKITNKIVVFKGIPVRFWACSIRVSAYVIIL